MESFDKVNYSIRPNKAIERELVFSGLRTLIERCDLEDCVFVGFGSVWFTDFLMAHRRLGVETMISLEKSEIGYKRAQFNRPFKTVEVIQEISTDALPILFARGDINTRPWIVWFDYDYEMSRAVLDDFDLLVERAPENSIVVFTYDGQADKYGPTKKRKSFLEGLFGTLLEGDDAEREALNSKLPEVVNRLGIRYLESYFQRIRRPGAFIPAFSMVYHDTATMATLGGVLAGEGRVAQVRQIVRSRNWLGMPETRIAAPHLTTKEALALQGELPRKTQLSMATLRKLGFALHEDSLRSYNEFYKEYPVFAKVDL